MITQGHMQDFSGGGAQFIFDTHAESSEAASRC